MAYHRQMTVTNSVALPINDTNRSFNKATIQPDVESIRVLKDPGVDPTSTLGIKVFAGGATQVLTNSEIAITKIISVSATNSTVDIDFE